MSFALLLLGAVGIITVVIWQARSPAPDPARPTGRISALTRPEASGTDSPGTDSKEAIDEDEVTDFTLAVTGGRPFLRTVSGPGPEGDLFLSATGVTAVGRSRENDIVISETAASTRHCRIEQQGATFVLIDLGSTNKTWVNGVETDRVVLKNGDQVTVGDTTMVFALFGDRA